MHPYACIEIPAGTAGEFVTDYISENGRRNQIIGELPINGIVQFIRISEIWGSRLPFITDPRVPDCFSVWVCTGAAISNVNPGSSTVTGSWGGSFAHPTVNWSVNWIGSVNTSPADFPRSTICPHIA